MLEDKIIGCLKGSLFNLNTQEIPNFWRTSPIWMEQFANESLQLYSIEANRPAVALEDGSIYLEPSGMNLVTYGLDFTNPSWIKGSNVFVLSDKAAMAGISGSELHLGDRIVWATGSDSSQKIQRTFQLKSGQDHFLSLILRLSGGVAGEKDVVQIAGTQIKLNQLNNFTNRVRILGTGFRAPGSQPTMPPLTHDESRVTYFSSPSGVTISPVDAINSGQLVGGRVQFATSNKMYTITNNTTTVNNSITLTLDTNPATDGVSVGALAYLLPPDLVPATLEFYVESAITLDILGVQIEPRNFRTSFIFQDDEIYSRSASKLIFRKNPLATLKTFGVLVSLREWRGDGNIFDAGNLSAFINNGSLIVNIGGAIIKADTISSSIEFYIQISQENNNAALYLNGNPVGVVNLIDFVGDRYSTFNLTSEGVRIISHIVFFDKLLQQADINKLFDGSVVVGAKLISSAIPLIALPALTVPKKNPPIAKSQIVDINPGNSTVTVANQSGFIANSLVNVVRDGTPLMRSKTGSLLGNSAIQLDTVIGIQRGDFLVFGNVSIPGQASARFPYVAREELKILEINPDANTLRVSSTLSFVKGRAFIRSDRYEEVSEIKIIDKDDIRLLLTVDDLTDIQVGHVISQPAAGESEMIVHPDNYEALFLNPVNGLDIAWWYNNGLVITNSLDVDVEIQPCIRVAY